MCLLLVKAGGYPQKWRSHGQKRKPFSENKWIVIPELLPVIHTCFFLCHVVCSAVILKLGMSTSTFHLIVSSKLCRSLTVCMFPSRRLVNFKAISKTACKKMWKVMAYHQLHYVQSSIEEQKMTSSDEPQPSTQSWRHRNTHFISFHHTLLHFRFSSMSSFTPQPSIFSLCHFHRGCLMQPSKCT